ncbi:MAG: hypothetical protein SGJ19_28755 [Planctomycetia bacterium]|nr:hypothetical protein [Planctomycetia bacterium]
MEVEQSFGIVGVFDALGVKNFDDDQIRSFVELQDDLRQVVDAKASDQSAARGIFLPKLFTFNDTIIVALEAKDEEIYEAIKGFATIVRRLVSFCLSRAVFLRGAFSIGKYIASDRHNLIMGKAVTDAATWYEKPELIGAIATPKASIVIRKHVSSDIGAKQPDFLLFEAEIPCKGGPQRLYAVNWPKACYVRSLRPSGCLEGKELAWLLGLLGAYEIPFGVEHKYRNTIEFFEKAPRD